MTDTSPKKPASADFYIKFGLYTVLALFGGLIFWSVVAPVDGAVIAVGQVVVESNRKAVQHLEGGVIEGILVREGEEVEAGEVVATLEDTVQAGSLALIDGQLTELYARRVRLEAERDGADRLAQPRGKAAVLNGDAFEAKLAGQTQLFEARRTTRLTQVDLLQERITQQKERIGGLNAQIDSLRDQRRLIEDELAGVRELNEKGFAPTTRVRALERESRRLSGERGALRAAIAEATSIIAEAELEIERLQEKAREDAISELRDVEVSIAELEERRIAADEKLERTQIRAPYAGRVMGLTVHTEGAVISPGAPLMEIVPRGDKLQIAARVAPRDVDKIQAGQETLVRFSAFGARMTPETTGVVDFVSADSFVDDKTGIPYYLVMVDIPQGEELNKILHNASLVPGMPVEAFIRTGSQPAISYFLKPLTDALARSMRE
ncbi:HlyD family type I secretion periplasmic adaptor subunit [Marinicaulis aureus]|uniref:Membrane fusion protein (MFP) family protein n=1 Tax=Hyphococcus aureus TaxID=2666033 RepID=A0ABW1KVA2_9PROT